ncbi:unnamed protein product [Lasius platythorax]|uniref:Uncharacterized protein n=1 Tax=Lasius platythorax TaxID=488582 RepID=A0AAV2P2Z1_9HYME
MEEAMAKSTKRGRMRRVIRCLSLPSTCPPDRFVGGNVGLENFTGITTRMILRFPLARSSRSNVTRGENFALFLEETFEREEKLNG